MNTNEELLCSFLTRIFTSYKLVTMSHHDQEELKTAEKAVLKNEAYKKFIISFIFYTFIFFPVSLHLGILKVKYE